MAQQQIGTRTYLLQQLPIAQLPSALAQGRRIATRRHTGEELLTHEGEETGILVEGRLELVVGLETFILEAGDSYYFESTKPHRFRNPFDVPARLISAATPANF